MYHLGLDLNSKLFLLLSFSLFSPLLLFFFLFSFSSFSLLLLHQHVPKAPTGFRFLVVDELLIIHRLFSNYTYDNYQKLSIIQIYLVLNT